MKIELKDNLTSVLIALVTQQIQALQAVLILTEEQRLAYLSHVNEIGFVKKITQSENSIGLGQDIDIKELLSNDKSGAEVYMAELHEILNLLQGGE